MEMGKSKARQILKVLDALIDTAQSQTDLDNVYNDSDGTFVSWSEVRRVREEIAEIGRDFRNKTVSHGTMRPQDLIPALMTFIRENCKAHYEAMMVSAFQIPPSYAREDEESEWWYEEECAEFLMHLFLLIDEQCAPEGFYFGAHPGDGSDYGFWEHEDNG